MNETATNWGHWSAAPAWTPFSYDALDADLAGRLRQQAERIRQRHAQTTQNMIETGRDLSAVKDGTEHGTFTAWVESECDITPRLAQMYMRAAEWVSDKSEIISLLQPTAIFKLSAKSTPENIRTDVVERVKRGERVQLSQIDSMLYNAREEKKERERLERMSPKTRKKREEEKAALAKRNEEDRRKRQEREQRNVSDATELATILAQHLPAEALSRAVELLMNEDITSKRWVSGVRMESMLVCELAGQQLSAPHPSTFVDEDARNAFMGQIKEAA